MLQEKTNDTSRADLDAQMEKAGLTPQAKKPKPEIKPEQEEKPAKKPEVTEEKPEDKKPEPEKPTGEDGADGKPKAEEKTPRPKKYIPLDEHQDAKKSWATEKQDLLTQIDTLKKGTGTEQEKHDDIETEIQAFAKDLGIEDPSAIKKLIDLAVKAGSKNVDVDALKKQIDALTEDKKKQEEDKAAADLKKKQDDDAETFDKEWQTFLYELKDTIADLSDDQIAEAKELMGELAHTEQWSKYDLSYVFYKNRKDFNDAIGTKKFKSAGAGRTQGITKSKEEKPGVPRLPKDPTPDDIRKYDKELAKMSHDTMLAQKANDNL